MIPVEARRVRVRNAFGWTSRHEFVVACLTTCIVVCAGPLHAAWVPGGTPVSSLPTTGNPAIASDGAGGAYVAFVSDGLRLQRLTSGGEVAHGWPADGVLVSTDQPGGVILSPDGQGGLYLATQVLVAIGLSRLRHDTKLTLVTSTGSIPSGWPVILSTGRASSPRSIVSDGVGGVFVAWNDFVFDCVENYCEPPDPHVYAARVHHTGLVGVGWPLLISTTPDRYASLARHPSESALWIAWNKPSLYVTRFEFDGTPSPGWSAGGVPGFVRLVNDAEHSIAAGNESLFLSWVDTRNEGSFAFDIYAQHLDASGSYVWPPSGSGVCTEIPYDQRVPRVVPDGTGDGVFIAWQDLRFLSAWKIYAQHLGPDGSPSAGWDPDGNPVATTPRSQEYHSLVADGLGGALISWLDGVGSESQIQAQRLTSNGTPALGWPVEGQALSNSLNPKSPPVLAMVAPGEAVAAWTEQRGSASTVLAQKTVLDGVVSTLVSVESAIVKRDAIRIRWTSPRLARRPVRIERSSDGVEWRELAQAEFDAIGRLEFEDPAVLPNQRYGYTVSGEWDGSAFRATPAWVTTAQDHHQVRIQPNPSFRISTITFDLTRGAALLSVVDLAGRVRFSREVGSMGPGTHVLPSTEIPRLEAGVYTVILDQEGSRSSRRFVIAR